MTELKSSKTKLDHLVDGIIRDVCELPDYNSPDDQPELLQATCSELEAILRNRLGVETDCMRVAGPEASGEATGPEGDDSNMGTAPTSGPEATSSQGNAEETAGEQP